MSLPYPPPWQDLSTLAQHICAGETTIEGWVRTGQFPQPKKVGGKRLWCWKEVERWLARDETAGAEISLGDRIYENARRVSRGG